MPKQGYAGPLEQIDECSWRIPKDYKLGMRVEGRIFADQRLIEQIRNDQAPEQVANVAFLPGIQVASLAMPDIHWGYGFCIGGVSATDPELGGVVSPGGVGYDINCGVRLMRTNLTETDLHSHLNQLMDALFRRIPAGVGEGGPYLFGGKELRRLLVEGAPYLVSRGWATQGDIKHTEAEGCLKGANPDCVTERALKRGGDQCGTLGSGNHFFGSADRRRNPRRSRRTYDGPATRRRLRDDPFGGREDLVIRCATTRCWRSGRRRRNTALNCPTGSWPVRRFTAPKAKRIWPRCVARRTMLGPTASC